MDVKSQEYAGKDRRGNGRLKLSLRDWYIILTIIIGTSLWLGKLQWTSADNTKKIEKVEQTPIQVAVIETEMKHINLKLIEQKESFDEFKTDQKEMNGKFLGKLEKQDDKLDEILEKM